MFWGNALLSTWKGCSSGAIPRFREILSSQKRMRSMRAMFFSSAPFRSFPQASKTKCFTWNKQQFHGNAWGTAGIPSFSHPPMLDLTESGSARRKAIFFEKLTGNFTTSKITRISCYFGQRPGAEVQNNKKFLLFWPGSFSLKNCQEIPKSAIPRQNT